MTKPSDKADLKEVVTFITEYTGISARLVKYIIKAYCTFILLKLYRGQTCSIPLVGHLYPKKYLERGGGTQSVAFTPSSRVEKFVYLNRHVDLEKVLESYKRFLENGRVKEEIDKFNRYSVELLELTVTDLKERAVIRSKANIDIVRNDLLRYLQREFPYELGWEHPITGNVYHYDRVAEKLKTYRMVDKEGYNLLYAVWLSLSDRAELREQLVLSEKQFEIQLRKVLDSVALLIMYPDLESEGLQTCYRVGLLGLETI
jgi:hypothetical protein